MENPIHSGTKFKEKFSTVVANCLESTECFKPLILDNILRTLYQTCKHGNSGILRLFKATTAMPMGTASVSGQNL